MTAFIALFPDFGDNVTSRFELLPSGLTNRDRNHDKPLPTLSLNKLSFLKCFCQNNSTSNSYTGLLTGRSHIAIPPGPSEFSKGLAMNEDDVDFWHIYWK